MDCLDGLETPEAVNNLLSVVNLSLSNFLGHCERPVESCVPTFVINHA